MTRTPDSMDQSLYGQPARMKYLYGAADDLLAPTAVEAEIDELGYIYQPPGSRGQGSWVNTSDQDITIKMLQNQFSNDEYHDDDTDWVVVGSDVVPAGGSIPMSIIMDHERITFTLTAAGALGSGGFYGVVNMLGDKPGTIPRPA